MKYIPNSMCWNFDSLSLKDKHYIKDLDFIKENTDVNFLFVAPADGVQPENYQQFHEPLKELVYHAHSLGIGISLMMSHVPGFFNASPFGDSNVDKERTQIYPLEQSADAEGIVNDYEVVLDEAGYGEFVHKAKWGRNKIRPLRSEILRAYSFEKAGDGFYKENSLSDITKSIRIIYSGTEKMEAQIYGGVENANKNVLVMVVQYFNYNELFGDSQWRANKKLMDMYSDIPLDGITMDETGYMFLNTRDIELENEEPFRGRFYSNAQMEYYKDKLNVDLVRLMFDMRFAPVGKDSLRIIAINRYFEELRRPPLRNEINVANYGKKLFGEDIYMSCHNTFHNKLDNDEIWRTACNWWDIPREYGHTDENITFPVRMGIMLACKKPLVFDMYYSQNDEDYFNHIIEGAPFNGRQIHHSYNEHMWGKGFFENKEFLKKIKALDGEVARLNHFQKYYPKLDLLIIYGAAAQNNWYPNQSCRNVWDINGDMKIIEKCDEMWRAGYRGALVPDYAIEDGRITTYNDKIIFNGHAFSHCLFLYPQYAKKETYEFINNAFSSGVKIAAVGEATMDFYANPVELNIPHFLDFSLSILEKFNCPKSAIANGCVYTDESFALVSKSGLLVGIPEKFDFYVSGAHYTGVNCGILAYRTGEKLLSTAGGALYLNGTKISN